MLSPPPSERSNNETEVIVGRVSSMLGMKSRATQSNFDTALPFPTLERRGQQAPPRNLTRVNSFPTLRGRRTQSPVSENKQLFLHNIDEAWRWRFSDCPWDEDPIPKHAWEHDRHGGHHWLDLICGGAPIGPPGNVPTMLWEIAPDRNNHPPRYHNWTFG